MRRPMATSLLWLAALFITLALAVFQRMTGPTYPLRGSVPLESETLHYRLLRTQESARNLPVRLEVGPEALRGTLVWRRYPSDDDWQSIPMKLRDGTLEAAVPSQVPAGKVEYRLVLESSSGETISVPDGEAVIARYKGSVPLWALIPHVIAMFSSMLLATRALLEVMRKDPRANMHVILALVLLGVGGLILGPIVQKYAFGAFWTGWPLGEDFTDNKTLLAFIAWLPAAVAAFRQHPLKRKVIVGWLVMMGVFLVPHSFRGSEVDWSQVE